MKELSSLDLHYLVQELKILEGGKIDKVFQDENIVCFQLHIPNTGKKYLTVILPSMLFLADKKDSGDGKFGLSIRKHISNSWIRSVEQIGFERILKITLEAKNKYGLYIELFRPGNIILTDDKNKIVMALTYKGFGVRMIRPNTEYEYPIKDFNFLTLTESDLVKLLEKSDKNSIVITLATELGLGGKYAEELCKLANIDKKKSAADDKETKRLYEAIQILRKPKKINKELAEEHTDNKEEKKESLHEKKKQQIMKMIKQQEMTIEGLEISAKENQKKGETIYENYQKLDKILKENKNKNSIDIEL
ncbi:MAG: NFACT family protein [Nanoarchaeota archaeon]